MPTLDRTSSSEAETRLIGRALGRLLRPGDIVLLDGPLGAGKTALVRAIAPGMGLDPAHVSSPTFVMIHEYPAAGTSPGLVHVDAYRLAGAADLDTLGWDGVDTGERPIVVEWAERLGAGWLAGRPAARIRIDPAGEDRRVMHLDLPDEWTTRPGYADLTGRQPTKCPVTGAPVAPDCPTYPFASERARMADLYRWFSGSYSVSREISPDEAGPDEAEVDEPGTGQRPGHDPHANG